MGDQLFEHVEEVSLWVDAVDAAAVQQRVNDSAFLSGIRVADKHPVFSTDLGGAELGLEQVGVQPGVTVLGRIVPGTPPATLPSNQRIAAFFVSKSETLCSARSDLLCCFHDPHYRADGQFWLGGHLPDEYSTTASSYAESYGGQVAREGELGRSESRKYQL